MRVIAIDGPVGSGKSTVAKAVAERLGLEMLETGAMYRAVAAAALRRGIEPGPETATDMARLARELDPTAAGEADLRSAAVNRVVSAVAAQAEVRSELVALQRRWVTARGGGVVEGRDIGTVVFPEASVKVFLTASEEERARRRGADETAADIARRDELDSSRAVSPLVAAADALVIDSTGRSIDDVVDQIVEAVARAGAGRS
ncbi:MAG TPA: (d)CMP kinase [Acidimicrobiales bacterium]